MNKKLFAIGAIPGKYFAADLEGADLLSIVEAHPTLFWTVLVIFAVACVGYCIYRLSCKKK